MKRKGKRKTSWIDRFVWGIGGLVALFSLLGFLGRVWWGFDLFSHFRVQYFQLCLVLIGVELWRRNYRLAITFLVLAGLNYAVVLPFYYGKPASDRSTPLRVMLINLNSQNRQTADVLATIQKANPDLLLLEEVTPRWAENLNDLKATYPYQLVEPRSDFYGIALFSKYPFKEPRVVYLVGEKWPSISTQVRFPQGTVAFLGTHPPAPLNAEGTRTRDRQLAAIADWSKRQTLPVLVLGDLNTSPWSSSFRKLLKTSGLKNSMQGFGFQPTWPVKWHFFQIPLDQALLSAELRMRQRAVLGPVGSDHYPLLLEFSFPEK